MRISVKFLIVVFFVTLDQISKFWVEASLPLRQSEAFLPYLSFYRTYNEGIAFSGLSFLGNYTLTAMIIVIIGFVIWLWSQLEPQRLISHLGFAFILSGAVGNLIDRVFHGHVIDFIQFHTQSWSFAIFNLADSLITIGAVLIVFDEVRQLFQPKAKIEDE